MKTRLQPALELLPVELWEEIFACLPPRTALYPPTGISFELNRIAIQCHLRRHGLQLDSFLQPTLRLAADGGLLTVLSLYITREELITEELEFHASWPSTAIDIARALGRLERLVYRLPRLRTLHIFFGSNLYRFSDAVRMLVCAVFAALAKRISLGGPVLICSSRVLFSCTVDNLYIDMPRARMCNPLFHIRCLHPEPCLLPPFLLDAKFRLCSDNLEQNTAGILLLNSRNASYFSWGDLTPVHIRPLSGIVFENARFHRLITLHLSQHVALSYLVAFLENHPHLERLEYRIAGAADDPCNCSTGSLLPRPNLPESRIKVLQLNLGKADGDAIHLLNLLSNAPRLSSFELLVDDIGINSLALTLRTIAVLAESSSESGQDLSVHLMPETAKSMFLWSSDNASIAPLLVFLRRLDLTLPSFSVAQAILPWLRQIPHLAHLAFTIKPSYNQRKTQSALLRKFQETMERRELAADEKHLLRECHLILKNVDVSCMVEQPRPSSSRPTPSMRLF
ncbi:hypothetical protein MIND_01279800 [Mycena indigotica]|uniref:F-box domain-containing protein n=1 Tax=Mycena indigotica TaxID=2126181 RepID=A0A8H6S2X6_9AGAR|nr:uncharacterized protein MIND_01279800 [Mycena indigotica]KAF7291353.1 hypothetical protein MIND_01279800 [Mycena indigotica]